MILSILSLLPIAVGLLLMALPHILPEELSSQVSGVARNICMGVALALLAISTWAAATSLSDIDWMNIDFGGYELENTPFEINICVPKAFVYFVGDLSISGN